MNVFSLLSCFKFRLSINQFLQEGRQSICVTLGHFSFSGWKRLRTYPSILGKSSGSCKKSKNLGIKAEVTNGRPPGYHQHFFGHLQPQRTDRLLTTSVPHLSISIMNKPSSDVDIIGLPGRSSSCLSESRGSLCVPGQPGLHTETLY